MSAIIQHTEGSEYAYNSMLRHRIPNQAQSPIDITSIASAETERFVQIIETVRAASGGRVPHNFNVWKLHRWTEARIEAGFMASDESEEKAKGSKGLIIRLARKVGRVQPAIDAFTGNLPASDYTFLVTGSVILLFKAFGVVTDVRRKVIDALGDCPVILEAVAEVISLYKDDQRLLDLQVELYKSILIAVEGMIAWLRPEHRVLNRLKAFPQQGVYGMELTEKIDRMHRFASHLNEQIDLCHQRITTEVHQMVQSLEEMVREQQQPISDILTGVRNLQSATEESHRLVTHNYSAMSETNRDSFENTSRQLDAFQKEQKEINARLEQLIKEARDHRDWAKKVFESRMQVTTDAAIQASDTEVDNSSGQLSNDEALDLLENRALAIGKQAEGCLELGKVIHGSYSLTRTILRNTKFAEWFSSAESGVLVVLPDFHTEKFPPGSILSATLWRFLSKQPYTKVIGHFFKPTDLLQTQGCSTTELVVDVVHQLIATSECDFRGWTSLHKRYDHVELLRTRHVDYLLDLLEYLMHESAPSTIFFLLDNVDVLEQNDDLRTLQKFLTNISDIVNTQDREKTSIFKILVVTPARKGAIMRATSSKSVIDLATDDQDDRRGNFADEYCKEFDNID